MHHVFSSQNIPLFNIYELGYDNGNAYFGPAQLNRYHAHFIMNGSGYFHSHKVTKLQGFCATPKIIQHHYPDKNKNWEYVWIASYDESILKFFDAFNPDPKTHIFSYNSACLSVLQEIKKFVIENHQKPVNSSILWEYFLKLFNKQISNTFAHLSNSDMYFDYSIDYISKNIYRRITVFELTNVLGITQPYLYKIFMDKIGKSPKQYIIDCKLKEAKRLLTETNLSVTEISNSVGFSDSLTFSKFFSARTNLSPKKFRNSLQY